MMISKTTTILLTIYHVNVDQKRNSWFGQEKYSPDQYLYAELLQNVLMQIPVVMLMRMNNNIMIVPVIQGVLDPVKSRANVHVPFA